MLLLITAARSWNELLSSGFPESSPAWNTDGPHFALVEAVRSSSRATSGMYRMWNFWRRRRAPTLAIIAPLRQVAADLLEWIAYHRAQGIDTFILGDNGGSDGTSELLAKLRRRGIVRVLDWRGRQGFQMDFCEQARLLARTFVDGAFIIDADEFLRPMQGRSVRDLATAWLADHDIGAVGINWAIYGSSGRQEPGDGLVIEKFTQRAEQDFGINRHVKTFVRTKAWIGLPGNPHAVTLSSGRYVTTNKADIVWHTAWVPAGVTEVVDWGCLRLDHFVVKSRAEFNAKKERGRVNNLTKIEDDYFVHHDRNEVEDPVPIDLVEKTKVELARLNRLMAATPAKAFD